MPRFPTMEPSTARDATRLSAVLVVINADVAFWALGAELGSHIATSPDLSALTPIRGPEARHYAGPSNARSGGSPPSKP